MRIEKGDTSCHYQRVIMVLRMIVNVFSLVKDRKKINIFSCELIAY